jgi:hypothetical protein
MAAREIGHGTLHPRPQVGHLGALFRTDVLVGEVALWVVASPAQFLPRRVVARASAQPVAADVQPDAAQPGAKLLGAPQAIEAQKRLQCSFLGDILRQVGIAHRPPAQREQKRPVPVEQQGKGILIAFPGCVHESRVVRRAIHTI